MRVLAIACGLLVAGAGSARADERITRASAALGAGGQGDALYGGVDLRLELGWRNVRAALGGRLVWLDGDLRRDWTAAGDALRVIRALEIAGSVGDTQLALAGGVLAPPELMHVADGYRARLDDRPVTGARAALQSRSVAMQLEVDDVVTPNFVGGALAWQRSSPWGITAAAAVDPDAGEAALELGGMRRWERTGNRTDLGAGLVVEPGLGVAAVGYMTTALDHAGARWTTSTEVRAGSGTVGAAFGPLHRVERSRLYDEPRLALGDMAPAYDGGRVAVGAAFSAGVASRLGWVRAGIRRRPDLGWLGTAGIGAPMGRYLQAAAWLAASRQTTAGAAELRVAFARRLSSALEVARMYDVDSMPAPRSYYSVTAWFAIAND